MTAATYLVYISLVIVITVLVARTLSKNGVLFLIDGFRGNEPLARSVNHLLVVGFYLINLGFALVRMETHRTIETLESAILFLTQNIGFVLLVVGVMHMLNLFIIGRYRQLQISRAETPKQTEPLSESPQKI
jgi:hypothetical protein